MILKIPTPDLKVGRLVLLPATATGKASFLLVYISNFGKKNFAKVWLLLIFEIVLILVSSRNAANYVVNRKSNIGRESSINVNFAAN